MPSAAPAVKNPRRLATESRVLPRLTRAPEYSAGSRNPRGRLILGENAATLRLLQRELAGSVRCVYIDPPYNNQETYNHYVDERSHEDWTDHIALRLELLAPLLRDDGSIWISIDDREVHHLRLQADRIFGRENFAATIVWEHRTTRENRKVFSHNHEYIVVYARDVRRFKATKNLLHASTDLLRRYKNPDNDPRGPWQSISLNVQAGHATAAQFYKVRTPGGSTYDPPKGRCWVFSQKRMAEVVASGNVWFGHDGKGVPRLKKFLNIAQIGLNPQTLWPAADVGTTDEAKKHSMRLFPNCRVFDTPKPESLLARILSIATNPGDLVLDAYLGSGTTAAVAHKMGRRYIGIEEAPDVARLCAQRMRCVIKGEAGGISEQFNWRGGGAVRGYRLAD